jgi:hypothetical protein
MYSILTATETACAKVAATLGNGYTVYTGVDNIDINDPAVICYAESASEDFPFSGIWHVKTSITIKQMAYDHTTGSMDSLVGTIMSGFLNGGIEAALSATGLNYAVYQVVPEPHQERTNAEAWTHTIGLDIVCVLT